MGGHEATGSAPARGGLRYGSSVSRRGHPSMRLSPGLLCCGHQPRGSRATLKPPCSLDHPSEGPVSKHSHTLTRWGLDGHT